VTGKIEHFSSFFLRQIRRVCNSEVALVSYLVQVFGCTSTDIDAQEQSVNDIATDLDPLDRIDRSIEIDASAERVWDLVTRPGWWINEGAVEVDPDVRVEGSTTVLTHAKFGEFRLETVESRPTTYIAYRWLEPDMDGAGTLVEFRIEPRGDGVTLSVAESGFSRLGKSREEWLKRREGNDTGWQEELRAAKTFVEAR
jgi:uncharacterized protein YndB with AHSA1/START domain